MLFEKENSEAQASVEVRSAEPLSFAASEAYKRLRTNVMYSLPVSEEESCRVIGITSALRGEGKSTTTINLAFSLAEAGKKVILIEADMRLPNIAKRLEISQTPGLSDFLVSAGSNLPIIKRLAEPSNLCVIAAGNVPPNPSELLSSDRMENLLKVLTKQFEYILIDLPPIGAVTDAVVISRLTDGMIIVVREDYGNKRALADAVRQLKIAKAKVLGFVVNDTKSLSGVSGGKGHYYGGYEKAAENV